MSTIFEEENIFKAILKMGLPAMLGSLATLIYNLVDMYFVSLTRDAAQIAAVTLCTPVLLIIMSIACIFGMGGSSVCARLIGEGKKDDSANCFNFCTYGIACTSIVVLLLGLLFTTPFANIIGADDSNLRFTCDYLRWIFIGVPGIMLANGMVHTFRSVGLIKEATIGVVLGNAINILLDYIFIVPLQMGTKGAAMATSIGFVCGTLYYFAVLIVKKKQGSDMIEVAPTKVRLHKDMVLGVIQIGIPGAMITVLMSVGNIVLNNFIAIYGSDAVASYGIAYKIDMFPIMLSVGLSQGSAPLLGYYYGKRDQKRLSKAMQIGTLYEVILGAAFMVLLFAGSDLFAGIFMKDDALLAMTSLFLKLLCFHAPFLGIINMVTCYFQALGKAANSLIITVLRNVVLFIPGVILLNQLFGLTGVILNQGVVEILLSIICGVLFLANKPGKLIHQVLQSAATTV